MRRALDKGQDVAHVHIRHIWPMPKNMSVLLKGFGRIIVPEMNMGQLKTLLRDQYLVDAQPLNKVSGQPFRISEIEDAIAQALGGRLGGEVRADNTQLPEPVSGHDDGELRGAFSPQSA